MKKIFGISLILVGISLAGCSVGDFRYEYPADGDSYGRADGMPSAPGDYTGEVAPAPSEPGTEDGGNGNYSSGIVTAGEWNDIANWDFWTKLLNNKDWAGYATYYKFYPRNFVYVELRDSFDDPVCGMTVTLQKNGQNEWETMSDNTGHAALWVDMTTDSFKINPEEYTLVINGTTYKELQFTTPNSSEVAVNKYTVSPMKVLDAIDVAFIVDATGSMGDEISFLKEDLKAILELVGQQCTARVRTGAVFYRDYGDEYITRDSKFTEDYKATVNFIGKQEAQGGGDWEEAVDEALKKGLDLGWDTHVKSRVAFMLLDAPPHHTDAILASCQKSIAQYAKMGIKIVPVSASGIDKGTEYLLRSFAMGTNGTYVFITNHSGVGNEHIEATVGEYQVEKLNDLIARLIIAYAK